MSSVLRWRPVEDYEHEVDDDVKFILRSHFQTPKLNNYILRKSDIPFLEGVVAGGTKEAQDLIDAINKHDTIELTEKY